MTATVNLTIALPKPPIKQAKLYINGQWRSASDGKTRPTISPITETAIADIPEASERDVEDAIGAARRAFDEGPWPKMTGHERQKILTRVSDLPSVLAATKIAPALAAGNTVIHKPASNTPLSAIKLAEIFEEAGLPAGVYNLVTGSGAKVGDQLVKHPAINKISFTGSTEVGMSIIRNSADTLKKTTMELGGESANIVFADADLDSAIANAFFGPVLTVIPFDTEAEAIRIANSTDFGLASGVHTRDIKKAMRVANAMQAGTCWINCYNIFDASVPFGGYKSSGFGRENGKEVMEDYTHPKAIWIDLS